MRNPERKLAKLGKIDDALERWWRKLKRAANEIDKLQAQRRRLIRPRRLDPHEMYYTEPLSEDIARRNALDDPLEDLINSPPRIAA